MITRYVNTSSTAGGDGTTNETTGSARAYATLSEALTSLGSSGFTEDLQILCCGSVEDTSPAVFNIAMMNSSYKVYVRANRGSLYGYHGGVWNNNTYRIVVAVDGTSAAIKWENIPYSIEVEGLQFRNNGATTGGRVIYGNTTSGPTTVVDNCIAISNHASMYQTVDLAGASGNLNGHMHNCIVLCLTRCTLGDPNGYGCNIHCTTGTFKISNTVIKGCLRGVYSTASSVDHLYNTNVTVFDNSIWDFSGWQTMTNCAQDDSFGTNPITIADWSAQFANANYVDDVDFRLKSSSALKNAGVGPALNSDVPEKSVRSAYRYGPTCDVSPFTDNNFRQFFGGSGISVR